MSLVINEMWSEFVPTGNWPQSGNLLKHIESFHLNRFESESEVGQSCPTLCDPMDTRLLRPWGFLGKSTGVGCHFLLQGIFPTQGLNPGLLHCRQTLYHLSHQGSSKQDFSP